MKKFLITLKSGHSVKWEENDIETVHKKIAMGHRSITMRRDMFRVNPETVESIEEIEEE